MSQSFRFSGVLIFEFPALWSSVGEYTEKKCSALVWWLQSLMFCTNMPAGIYFCRLPSFSCVLSRSEVVFGGGETLMHAYLVSPRPGTLSPVPGGGNGSPIHHSCLENPADREPWLSRGCTCPPSWIPIPPPSPSHPSGPTQRTSPEHPISCIKPGLAICFTYNNTHVSMLFSQIIPPLPSPTESKRLHYTSVSLLLSRIQGLRYHLSKFHIYALFYCIGIFLSDSLHSV